MPARLSYEYGGAQSTRTSLGAEQPWTLSGEGLAGEGTLGSSIRRVNPLFDAASITSIDVEVREAHHSFFCTQHAMSATRDTALAGRARIGWPGRGATLGWRGPRLSVSRQLIAPPSSFPRCTRQLYRYDATTNSFYEVESPDQRARDDVYFTRVKRTPGHKPREAHSEFLDPADPDYMFVLFHDEDAEHQTAFVRQSRL